MEWYICSESNALYPMMARCLLAIRFSPDERTVQLEIEKALSAHS